MFKIVCQSVCLAKNNALVRSLWWNMCCVNINDKSNELLMFVRYEKWTLWNSTWNNMVLLMMIGLFGLLDYELMIFVVLVNVSGNTMFTSTLFFLLMEHLNSHVAQRVWEVQLRQVAFGLGLLTVSSNWS